jgi:hypothetical protein
MVVHGCKERLSDEDDRKDLEKRYEAVLEILNGEPARITMKPGSDSKQHILPELGNINEI